MNNDKADFTQGSILKKLIAFMIPVLGTLILQAAYGAVDLLVVYGQDCLDEISLSAPTSVCEIKDGTFEEYVITPEEDRKSVV